MTLMMMIMMMNCFCGMNPPSPFVCTCSILVTPLPGNVQTFTSPPFQDHHYSIVKSCYFRFMSTCYNQHLQMPLKFSHDINVPSFLINTNGVYYQVFDMSKLYEKFFRMLRNVTKDWRYLCFLKHRRTNIGAYLNIYSRGSFTLLKGNSAIGFNYWNDNSEKFKGFKKSGGFDYIPYEDISW